MLIKDFEIKTFKDNLETFIYKKAMTENYLTYKTKIDDEIIIEEG